MLTSYLFFYLRCRPWLPTHLVHALEVVINLQQQVGRVQRYERSGGFVAGPTRSSDGQLTKLSRRNQSSTTTYAVHANGI